MDDRPLRQRLLEVLADGVHEYQFGNHGTHDSFVESAQMADHLVSYVEERLPEVFGDGR